VKKLDTFICEYVAFEQQLRTLMVNVCGRVCSICTARCCRPDICEEARDSTFLQLLLKRQGLSEFEFDDRYGWLGHSGCRLEYGRPPVCYEYFCNELLSAMPDNRFRDLMRQAGALPAKIGRNALGKLHLTEIINPAELNCVSFDRLSQRLEQARLQLKEIIQALEEYFPGLELTGNSFPMFGNYVSWTYFETDPDWNESDA